MGLATLHNNNTVRTLVRDIDDITTPIDTTAQANKTALLRNLSGLIPAAAPRSGGHCAKPANTSRIIPPAGDRTPILPASKLGGECQQNFTILMSDGIWNGGDPVAAIPTSTVQAPIDGGDCMPTPSVIPWPTSP